LVIGAVLVTATVTVLAGSRARADLEEIANKYSERVANLFAGEIPDMVPLNKRAGRCLRLINEWTGGNAGRAGLIVGSLEAIKPKHKAAESRGVGVVILVDTSGSMDDPPKSGGERKILGANRAAAAALTKLKAFQGSNPGVQLSVGVYRFSSSVSPVAKFQKMGPSFPTLPALTAEGGTAIGKALLQAKKAMNAAKIKHQHIILITDGENSAGIEPLHVIQAFNLLSREEFPILHFIAFDIQRARFAYIQRMFLKQIYEARDSRQLGQIMDSLLQGEVLAEARQ
jgi:uncharacterized protein YegL